MLVLQCCFGTIGVQNPNSSPSFLRRQLSLILKFYFWTIGRFNASDSLSWVICRSSLRIFSCSAKSWINKNINKIILNTWARNSKINLHNWLRLLECYNVLWLGHTKRVIIPLEILTSSSIQISYWNSKINLHNWLRLLKCYDVLWLELTKRVIIPLEILISSSIQISYWNSKRWFAKLGWTAVWCFMHDHRFVNTWVAPKGDFINLHILLGRVRRSYVVYVFAWQVTL